jgi:cell division protein ZapA (FtsZ GTPase activity inhibitor)
VRKLLGRNDIEDALKKLDTLTLEEARMSITENLNVTHIVDKKVTVIMESEQEVLEVTNRVDENVSTLVAGGQYAFSFAIHAFLNINTTRCERNQSSRTAVGQHRIL